MRVSWSCSGRSPFLNERSTLSTTATPPGASQLDSMLEEPSRQLGSGWASELVAAADIDAAIDDLWEAFPRPEEFQQDTETADPRKAAFMVSGDHRTLYAGRPAPPPDGPEFRVEQFLGHLQFPFPGGGTLNRLLVHPNVVEFAKQALGSDDVRIYQSQLWAKYAGVTNYAQPFHRDGNHSFVPPRMEQGWWHLEGISVSLRRRRAVGADQCGAFWSACRRSPQLAP